MMNTHMIISVVLLVLVACARCEDEIKWAGDTTGFFNKIYPPVYSNGVCSTTSSSSYYTAYAKFTNTFSTPGVREVAAMAEKLFKSDIRIYIYNATFYPSSTCTNLFFTADSKQFASQGGPVIDEIVHFEANVQYTFVISSASTISGLFAVNVLPSDGTGALAASGPLWTPLSNYDSSSYSCTTITADPTPYGTYTWTQTTSGYFDVYALFDNPALASYASYIALYNSTLNVTALETDACNAGTLIQAGHQLSFGVYLPYIWLGAGTSYTVILSGYQGTLGYWGVQVIPTRVRFFHNSPQFIQPARTTDSLLCSQDTSHVNAAWDTTIFTTEFATYLVDTGSPPPPFSTVDTYSFLYTGNNPGNNVAAPVTCPTPLALVSQGDTGDITPVFASTSTGKNYTVVVSTYNGNSVGENSAYTLYLFTGRQVSEQGSDAPKAAMVSVIGLFALVISLVLF